MFIRGKNPITRFHYFAPIFYPYNALSMGRSTHHRNEACGPTVVADSLNNVL